MQSYIFAHTHIYIVYVYILTLLYIYPLINRFFAHFPNTKYIFNNVSQSVRK